jgi:hypothetical protein
MGHSVSLIQWNIFNIKYKILCTVLNPKDNLLLQIHRFAPRLWLPLAVAGLHCMVDSTLACLHPQSYSKHAPICSL